ncbi:uncharacterized protein PRCAT00002593001 [Priceomyces carsonii]|uniref:uncharacterized protein n=1 Tax=Priceomyces carsonii TaxID=28549 RepID=UPI002EDAF977|nr:unnamed protein product [Priceomyces carsonii]
MASESTTIKINHITALVSKQLRVADEKLKCSTKEHFDWNSIKRAPQFLKQKAKLGSCTIDEEFNEHYDNLQLVERKMQTLSKYSKILVEKNLLILETSESIGLVIKELFDPYNSLPKSVKQQLGALQSNPNAMDNTIFLNKSSQLVFEEEYRLWEDAETYIDCIKNIYPAIKGELELMGRTLDNKVIEVLRIIKNIKKKIKIRSYALLDYDKAFNSQENLLIKQKSDELTIKQSQQLYNLERKLGEYKLNYDTINSLLKRELPCFFKLVDMILQPIQLMVYYVQLMVSYQIHSNLRTLRETFNIDENSYKEVNFNLKMIEEFNCKNQPATDIINGLTIVNFKENFLNNLVDNGNGYVAGECDGSENFDPSSEYCQALFNYKGEEIGDISINTGDIIKIINKEGNWWKGEINGKVGLFPGNYVKVLI